MLIIMQLKMSLFKKKVHRKVAEKLEIPFKTIVKVVEPA